jgi:hypothetical protein
MWRNYGWATKPHRDAMFVPLKPDIDPEHLDPTANTEPVVGVPLWVSTVRAPGMDESQIAEPYATGAVTGGGPIDHTPEDPNFGVGVGHGQSVPVAQEVRTVLMEDDRGATAARRWQAKTDRDGTPRMAFIPDMAEPSDSPQTHQLQRSGVGQPNDPFARRARRFWRWWDRKIDMHRYVVERRPRYGRNAYTAQAQPPVANPSQLDSPYPTSATYWPGSDDRFVLPQTRRTPRPWDDPGRVDAQAERVNSGFSEQLLPAWGL